MATDTAIRASSQKLLEGVQIIGFDWTYLYLNEAAERHARRQAHELVGRRMMDCYPGIDQTPLFDALTRVMQARKPEQLLTEFVYPDASQGWFDLRIEPATDGICVLSLDISALRAVTGTETVLLVEDDESARELMRNALSPHGYTVLEARDVWDALTLARSRPTPIDLLLTDIVMPEMNGPQLAQHIVSMHPKIRVLYVSGYPQAAAIGSSAISANVSFLPRPFPPGALLASVREALDR